MDCVELLVPRECCSAYVLLLSASSGLAERDFSVSKEKAATLIFHYKSHISCALPWGPAQSSAHQPTSEWVSGDYAVIPPLQHTSHVMWKCLSWQELQMSFSPLRCFQNPHQRRCVCVEVRKDMDRHGSGRAHQNLVDLGLWGAADNPKGKVPSGAPWEQHGTCGWQRHRAEDAVGLSWSARGSPSIHTQIHIKRNSCFTALTSRTSRTASFGLCQKTRPVLSHVFVCDFSGCRIRPWGCLVHSTVHSPRFPSVHFKGRHCFVHNAAITSTILRRINQRQHNSQIQRIPKLRSDSVTQTDVERDRLL